MSLFFWACLPIHPQSPPFLLDSEDATGFLGLASLEMGFKAARVLSSFLDL